MLRQNGGAGSIEYGLLQVSIDSSMVRSLTPHSRMSLEDTKMTDKKSAPSIETSISVPAQIGCAWAIAGLAMTRSQVAPPSGILVQPQPSSSRGANFSNQRENGGDGTVRLYCRED